MTATPSNPDAPNGETFVDIGYWVRDDISGLGKVSFRLRDPQGIEHHYYHYHDNFYGLTFDGDPTAWQGYDATVVLPVGSAPGIWGHEAELYLQDKANNIAVYDFTETIRFDLDGNEMINVPDGGQSGGDQPHFDMDDDEGISNPDDGQSEIDHVGDGGHTMDPVCVDFESLTLGHLYNPEMPFCGHDR